MESNNQYNESQREIEEHLMRFATTYAYSKGYKFGFGAENDIGELSKKSADNITNPKSDYLDVPINLLIGVAEKSIGIFIDHMIMAGPKVYLNLQNKDNILGEQTYAWAKKLLCPMYPLC